MKKKSIVLSSGGVDSTTCLGIAIDKYGKDNVSAVSITYGQKHSKEIDAAKKIAEYYGIKHYDLDLSEIFKYSNCSLLKQSTEDVPEGAYADQINRSETGVVSTFVPFRNGTMLSAVAALALSIYPGEETDIVLGAHADDAAGNAYPDCSKAFTDAMALGIDEGSDHRVHVVAPLVEWNKAQVVKRGLELKVPYHLTTSCYNGRDKACTCCGTCIDRIEAFRANGVIDPVPYEKDVDWSGCKEIDYLAD